MKKIVLLAGSLLLLSVLNAQSSAFGVKGGVTLGIQNWSGLEQDPLFKYHGIVFIESYNPEEPFAVFAQAGIHQKGSALRNRNYRNSNNEVFRAPAREFIFNNLSLTLGAKQKFPFSGEKLWYWMLGLRGDYTLSTNLDEYTDINLAIGYPIYPLDAEDLIRDFNYGITFGAGIDFPLADLIGVLLEFTVNPDLSYQYIQPSFSVNGAGGSTSTLDVPERRIRNLTFEVTLGFRFLRLVEYVD